MWRPQLIRDSVGLHCVWGRWCLSKSTLNFWRFGHLHRSAAMGATQIDIWLGLGLRLDRVQTIS